MTSRVGAAVLALAGAIGMLSGPVGVTPAAAASGSAACTEAGVRWRVDYTTVDTAYGPTYRVAGLKRIEGGAVADAGAQTWSLRWENTAAQWPPGGPSYQSKQGPLSVLDDDEYFWWLSPRLVTPDGQCQVYLTPFSNPSIGDGTGKESWPKIAVLGDDLLKSLNDAAYNVDYIQGRVEGSLVPVGIKVEVEGKGGARWTDAAGTSGLAKADTYMLDEFRALLEHDPDGFVVGLGMNDALYIATGATAADRTTRRNEVAGKLTSIADEMTTRSGCVVAVTSPQNPSGWDADYAFEAQQLNNLVRYYANSSSVDALELVDFGAMALGHKSTDPAPWFASDNLTLNAAGKTAYTGVIHEAARRCADSVVLHGTASALDDGALTGHDVLPSGQAFRAEAGPVDFEQGKRPWFGTVAADGTVFTMTTSSAGKVIVSPPTGEGMTVGAFNPETRTFTNIKIKTDRGKEVPLVPEGMFTGGDLDGRIASDTLDVETLNGGEAVVFTGGPGYWYQNLEDCGPEDHPCTQEAQGQFPAFGVLTKGPDGSWRVAEGPDSNGDGRPDWRNSWSPRELEAATLAADPVHGQELFDAMCHLKVDLVPPDSVVLHREPSGELVRDCKGIQEIAVLPSNDVVITTYFGPIVVLDLSGPDASGRFTAHIAATETVAPVHDPYWPDEFDEAACDGSPPADANRMIHSRPREVQADPTSVVGDERFAFEADTVASRYVSNGTNLNCIGDPFIPGPLIEYSYNANAAQPEDRIKPVSPPVFSGETTSFTNPHNNLKDFTGNGQFRYDHQGSLWVGHGNSGIKVYAKTAQGRSITRTPCVQLEADGTPKPLDQYTLTAEGVHSTWGAQCPADYLLVQPGALGGMGVWGLEEDPVTHNMVAYAWPQGYTMVIDPEGSGANMTFGMSNLADPMGSRVTEELLSGPCSTGPCERPPSLETMILGVDGKGRAWFAISQGTPRDFVPNHEDVMTREYDQWLFSVDLSRLLGREPQQLTAQSGQATIVQGEVTKTKATTKVDTTVPADWRVESDAGVSCRVSCTDGKTPPLAGGYSVGDEGTTGLPAGKTVEYRITVPKSGTYALTYRAADRGGADTAVIRLSVDGGAPVDRPIPTAGMEETTSPISLNLTAGTHTLVLSAPTEQSAGWQLDWMRFSRS